GVAIFKTSGAFKEEEIRRRIGLSLEEIDEWISAQNFTEQWTFTVVHTMEPIDDLKSVEVAMGLKPQKPINDLKYYVATKNASWLRAAGKLALLAPTQVLDDMPPETPQALYVHQRDRQTLIFANQLPMEQYLRAKGRFDYWGGAKPAPA